MFEKSILFLQNYKHILIHIRYYTLCQICPVRFNILIPPLVLRQEEAKRFSSYYIWNRSKRKWKTVASRTTFPQHFMRNKTFTMNLWYVLDRKLLIQVDLTVRRCHFQTEATSYKRSLTQSAEYWTDNLLVASSTPERYFSLKPSFYYYVLFIYFLGYYITVFRIMHELLWSVP